MREKIKAFSKGQFKYQLPNLQASVERLVFSVQSGKKVTGTVEIENDEKAPMKGMVYSSDPCMRIQKNAFVGERFVLEYSFDAGSLKPGTVRKGKLTIVSSLGEMSLPFEVTVQVPFLVTTYGKMRDLFHFANLAKDDWNQALEVFQSKEFETIFFQKEDPNRLVYRALKDSSSPSRGMEEFLIAVHKKAQIHLTLSSRSFEYQNVTESFADKVLITKDQWGYMELKVESRQPFLVPRVSVIHNEQFVGSQYPLEFFVDAGKLHEGENYGFFVVQSPYETMEVEVRVSVSHEERVQKKRSHKKELIKLTRNYLDFRLGRTSKSEYITDTDLILGSLSFYEKEEIFDLYRIHLYLIDNRVEKAQEKLDFYRPRLEGWKQEKPLCYGTFLYLEALWKKDRDVTLRAGEEVERLYERTGNWRFLWMLIYLGVYKDNLVWKERKLREAILNGSISPVLYYELLEFYNENPEYLIDLDKAVMNAVIWGIREQVLSPRISLNLSELLAKERVYGTKTFRVMKYLYEQYHEDLMLQSIIQLLIAGDKTGSRYVSWYQLGIEKQVKVTKLYEYYMYSIEEDTRKMLPVTVFSYFMYNNDLPAGKKAFLYANLIRNKDYQPGIYHQYMEEMLSFAKEQLFQHKINRNLAVIYEELIHADLIDEQVAKALPCVMFTNELYCENPNMKGVVVLHKEIDREAYMPLEDGVARISVFTENAHIFLVDKDNNRYAATVDYTLNKLLHLEELADLCLEKAPDNGMLLLYQAEQMELYHKHADNITNTRRRIILMDELKGEYRRNCALKLIDYYYESFDGEQLDALLGMLDLSHLEVDQRCKMIEYFILRELYERAETAIRQYGYVGVSPKKLMRFASYCIQALGGKEDPLILELSFYVFDQGKYDEKILSYLASFFSGTTEQMFQLWERLTMEGIHAKELEERLLAQILFTENEVKDAVTVFLPYFEQNENTRLSRAFLAYYSYRYLVFDQVLRDELFQAMDRFLSRDQMDIIMLAWMKRKSRQENLTKEEQDQISHYLSYFIDKEMILPFFQDFKKRMRIPYEIYQKCYVEYITNPEHPVTIGYMIDGSEEEDGFLEEKMRTVYPGIFVREFTLFYNETLKYYIKEEIDGEEVLTESCSLTRSRELSEEDNAFNLINLMLAAKEMGDNATLLELMENYVMTDYLIEHGFEPIL
ncbi:MAG: DUF5717 family protein [Clostridiales bacterium]|nr:DUF5717 family protein [Clostridiales bacterium]